MCNNTRKEGNDTSGFFQNIGPWYMLRLKFMPTWLANKIGFNIFIHLFLHSDLDVPHDHPWDSYSVILWGRLREWRQEPRFFQKSTGRFYNEEYETQLLPRWKIKFREATYRHAVILESKFAITVFIPRAVRRGWYFYPEGRPVYWREFLRLDNP